MLSLPGPPQQQNSQQNSVVSGLELIFVVVFDGEFVFLILVFSLLDFDIPSNWNAMFYAVFPGVLVLLYFTEII